MIAHSQRDLEERPIEAPKLPYNATVSPLQVHLPSHPPRPPTLAECEVIIKHMQQTNDRQAHEVKYLNQSFKISVSSQQYNQVYNLNDILFNYSNDLHLHCCSWINLSQICEMYCTHTNGPLMRIYWLKLTSQRMTQRKQQNVKSCQGYSYVSKLGNCKLLLYKLLCSGLRIWHFGIFYLGTVLTVHQV